MIRRRHRRSAGETTRAPTTRAPTSGAPTSGVPTSGLLWRPSARPGDGRAGAGEAPARLHGLDSLAGIRHGDPCRVATLGPHGIAAGLEWRPAWHDDFLAALLGAAWAPIPTRRADRLLEPGRQPGLVDLEYWDVLLEQLIRLDAQMPAGLTIRLGDRAPAVLELRTAAARGDAARVRDVAGLTLAAAPRSPPPLCLIGAEARTLDRSGGDRYGSGTPPCRRALRVRGAEITLAWRDALSPPAVAGRIELHPMPAIALVDTDAHRIGRRIGLLTLPLESAEAAAALTLRHVAVNATAIHARGVTWSFACLPPAPLGPAPVGRPGGRPGGGSRGLLSDPLDGPAITLERLAGTHVRRESRRGASLRR